MNVTVEISNDCNAHWIPDGSRCENWIQTTLDCLAVDKIYSVSLRFVEESESIELNHHYRSKHTATNVLSFPTDFPENLIEQLGHEPLGDIVICPYVVEQEADSQGKTLEAHWAHLLIHGLLHLLGCVHDSEENTTFMENLEIKALERLGFPNPYLIG